MTDETDAQVEAVHEEEHSRTRLLRYPDKWAMTYERRKVGGGWYVRNVIEVPLPARQSIQHSAESCPGRPCSTDCDHVEFTYD